MFTDETLYSIYGTWLHRILVYDSMSTIGIWVLRATPPWRDHLQRPLFRDIDRNWELRATPLWWEPPPEFQFH